MQKAEKRLKEMKSIVKVSDYGYICSKCLATDYFNEELLFETPPLNLIMIKLQQYWLTCHPPKNCNQTNHPMKCYFSHTIPCTKRFKHLPLKCQYSEGQQFEKCFKNDHWRNCNGFYHMMLALSYKVDFNMLENEGFHTIRDINIIKIVPNVKLNEISPFQHYDLECDDGLTDDECYFSQIDSYSCLRERCRAIMDFLFTLDCSYVLTENFYYKTHTVSRETIIEKRKIPKVKYTLVGIDGKKQYINGVLLYEDLKPSVLKSGQFMKVSADNIGYNLVHSKGNCNPKLYYHSHKLYRCENEKRIIHVTLLLLCKSSSDLQEYFDEFMEPLNLRFNPFLQISPSLNLIRIGRIKNNALSMSIKLLIVHSLKLSVISNTHETKII